MSLFITVIGAIMAVFIVIVLHELGHFCVAKACGVRVLRFSIGFGKPLWSRVSRGGTKYVLAILPLGGYVKLLDDREVHVSSAESRRAYNRQPVLVRMAIVVAGPVSNLILAVIVFWFIFLLGVSYLKPVIGSVAPQSLAGHAGLQAGDTLVAINGRSVKEWQGVITSLVSQIGAREVNITTQPANHGPLQNHLLPLRDWKLSGTESDPLVSLGITPYEPAFPAVIEKVMPRSPAARNGLQASEEIVALNHQPVADWRTVSDYVHKHPNQEMTLEVKQQDGVVRNLNIQLDSRAQQGQLTGYLGVQAKIPIWPNEMILKLKYSVLSAWPPAWREAWGLVVFNWTVVGKMLSGKISLQSLGGPITIFRSAGEASQAGLAVYLSFIGFISVTLGFLNILPIPGLDGGHFLFQVIESIIRRPIPERYQMVLLKMGIVLILLLIVQGTINDVVRLL